MPYKKSPYHFRCFFNRVIWCGEFAPKIWKKRHRLPEPCKRCRFYLNRAQQNLNTLMDASPHESFCAVMKLGSESTNRISGKQIKAKRERN